MTKIVRTICYFTEEPGYETVERLNNIEDRLESKGYNVQTKRICSPNKGFQELKQTVDRNSILLSTGSKRQITEQMKEDFFQAEDVSFNLDLTDQKIEKHHIEFLFSAMKKSPSSTFSFCYSFNNPDSSPFHPPAQYGEEGFSIGLQATNLSEGCESMNEWFENMREAWEEIQATFDHRDDFLGIDSSIAPFKQGNGSLVDIIRRFGSSFERSVTQKHYLRITDFIQNENPCPVGLCGMMLPCLEDFALAEEYARGEFPVERNIFLSLHSGLGVDTYPIGLDEDPGRVQEIANTVKALSNKHDKPLSMRFVSDGQAKVGDKTDFQNKWLKDVEIRKL